MRVIKTTVVALVALSTLAGSGFALQAAVLGRPGPDHLVVTKAVAKLLQYDNSTAVITLNGVSRDARCREVWRDHQREATVELSRGPALREIGNTLVHRQPADVAAFELAGCPRPLRKWLTTQINHGSRIELSDERVDGHPVYRVHFLGTTLGLDLYVSRRSGMPVALTLREPGLSGTSRLRYGLPAAAKPAHPSPSSAPKGAQ